MLAALTLVAANAAVGASGLSPFKVDGDSIPQALTDAPGDPVRGRALVVDRQKGLCLLCHTGPFPEQRFQGNVAPDLAGAGARWSVGQLRLRIVDGALLNPDTVMPSYYRTHDLTRVAAAFASKPILDAQEVEDVVAFLATLTAEALSQAPSKEPK